MAWGRGAVGLAMVFALAVQVSPAAGTATAAQPQQYRDQPALAYVSNGRLFVLDGAGNPPQQVLGVRNACCVAISPDGSSVAFEQRNDLWVVGLHGTGLHRVARSVRRWAWAPDGQALAVLPMRGPDGAGLGIDFYGDDDSSIRQTLLPDARVHDLAWAGLGRRIAVVAVPAAVTAGDGAPSQLFMLEVPGPYGEDCPGLCAEAPLTVPLEHPDPAAGTLLANWSPHADAIALWTRPGDGATLGLASPRGGVITPVAVTPVHRSWVQWSNGGDRLLVVEGRGRAPSAPRSLLLCTRAAACRPITANDEPVADPAWSRAGAIAYVRSVHRELWIADEDGGSAHPVAAAGTGVAAPRWLPDGHHLVFARDRLVWLLDTAGGEPVPVAGPLDGDVDRWEKLYSVGP